ncbi:probable WRKY transcription factor 27 [Solanum dulcamara]|uniref:probable WRKY transcription factor 27 n=1 Tax=Solanum dulcamara TaxID=45834 RepID=UPI0024851397|nr:probable WRKY transcription factor 27 [Solanum dulcamara]
MESMNFVNDDWNFDKLSDVDMTKFYWFPEIFPMNFPVEITNPTTSVPIIVDQVIMDQNNNRQLLEPFQSVPFNQQIFLPSPLPPSITTLVYEPATIAAPQEWIDLQQQSMMSDNIHPTFTLPMITPLIQTHTKKNQPTKTTYELMGEELTNDSWTWNKNGEKRIKSSQFLRNYYKCATLKDCKAKKQIEKSPRGENLFLVTYYGEHNHPPPINRRSHAGWNGSTKHNLPKGINIVPKALSLNSSTSSLFKLSIRSKVVASPIGPTIPMIEIESASPNKDKMVVVATENKGDDREEKNVVLIPDKFVSEDILVGFEELNGDTSST